LQFDFQDGNSTLFFEMENRRIKHDIIEKIFTWYNQQTNVDMALSFQNEAAAQTLW